jgi:hypothetical protein
VSNNPLVGTWRLVSFEVRDEDGRITHPLGEDAVGFITYAPDGHMAVQFGRADRVLPGRRRLGGCDACPRLRRRPATTSHIAAPTSSATVRSCTGLS